MTFLLNEDKAIKAKLAGITVSDAKNASRPVGVWFGQPDIEVRDQAYPYLTLDLVDISEAKDRNNRGFGYLPYTPEGEDDTQEYFTELPIPVDIDYQVTSYARQPLHDRQIISRILYNILPFRYGTLEIPEDNTLRRVELLGYTKRDTTEQGKRLFVNVFSIRVNSELLSTQIAAAVPVATVNTTTNESINESVTPPA
ncbi:hypothetical protein UFOVP621_31 [uncultured Caudovirales phage]|uniref:Uncharacterized protein n=1 Tax=uncultured Caudovirales phage TaxID=2100421 RepID=A0A6J5N6S1_9CAUD|nr:hypothetical protein UFOVP621_31 [uncultured Caudovirales phage]